MSNKKKIILIGPPATGKTTITKVFFQKANPIKLLYTSLEPTRGVNSNIFSLFNSQLGIFDLAGQENKNWLLKERDVFDQSNVITCVFDINNSLEKIISFLVKIIRIKKELNSLSNCKIFAFLHKIDMVGSSYLSEKIKAIKNFLKSHYTKNGININIFGTSITKEHFYNTFQILLDILTSIYQEDFIPISKTEFESLKQELIIIIKCELNVKYKVEHLSYKFNLDIDKLYYHLERLEKLGMIEFLSYRNFIRLTQRSDYLKTGLKKEINKVELIKENKKIKLFYTFLQLNEILST
ncbi:MAG: 50S ribosome-binding GTPase [Candidatus Lokiarchaeota archaeon]|nr:50S ribosome-binding GTPase [Candidatus Lokiarchaeota archaeon]